MVVKDGDGNHSYGLTKRNGLLLSGLDLEIFYVRQKEDEGRYTCVAKNKFGEKRYQIKLFVNSKKFRFICLALSVKKSDNSEFKVSDRNTFQYSSMHVFHVFCRCSSDDSFFILYYGII